ncbi:MAG: hypothetical protein AABW51_03905 [Nanoarchaeota archaeon]
MSIGNESCPKCKGAGRIKKADGSIQTCFDCLLRGEMDQHSKDVKDATQLGLKL